MLVFEGRGSQVLSIGRESDGLDALGQRGDDQLHALHGCRVPNDQARLGSDLTCRDVLTRRVSGKAVNVVVVTHEELLGVTGGVQDHADTSCMVDDVSTCRVSQVVSGVVAAVAVNPVELKLSLRLGAFQLVGLVAGGN